MKAYEVQLDITIGGIIVNIEANSKEEAKKKALEKDFYVSDLKNGYIICSTVVDIGEV